MSTCTSSQGAEIPSLYEQLEQVPDSRDDQGKRHPLAAMLALACVALLCGYENPNAISEWVDNYGKRYLKRFRFTRDAPMAIHLVSRIGWYRLASSRGPCHSLGPTGTGGVGSA